MLKNVGIYDMYTAIDMKRLKRIWQDVHMNARAYIIKTIKTEKEMIPLRIERFLECVNLSSSICVKLYVQTKRA